MNVLRRSRAFALTIVLTLAAGIGSVVTMVSVYSAVVLHPVTVPSPDDVMSVYAINTKVENVPATLSWPKFDMLRRNARAFASMAAYTPIPVTLAGPDGLPEQLRGLRVSGDFFGAAGVSAARGRVFSPQDDLPNGPNVCLLSDELWRSRFGGRDVVGTVIQLDQQATEIIGVLPPRLSTPWADREVLLPRVFDLGTLSPQSIADAATFLEVVGRLRQGTSPQAAQQELTSIAHEYGRQFAGRGDASSDVAIHSLTDDVVGTRRSTFTLLLAAVALVLLVSCANASTLVLGHLVERQRETAIRQALGGSRAVLVRQFVTENLVLAAVAGAAGVGFAIGALRIIEHTAASALPPGVALRVNAGALIVTIGVVAVSSLLVALMPALHVTRPAAASSVNGFARGLSAGVRTRTFRRALITVEVALSVCLLVQATLLLTSLARLNSSSPGFDPHGVAAAFAILPAQRYATPAQQEAFFLDAIERLKADPRVTGAAAVFGLPFHDENSASRYVISGRPAPAASERPRAGFRIVTEDYFKVMRIPLLQGRGFTAGDRTGAKGVCIVNASFARRQFSGQSAIGQVILRGRDANQPFEVVGVVADVKTNGLRNPTPDEIFYSFRQIPRPDPAIVVRTSGDVGALRSLLQSTVAALDPGLPISRYGSMDDRLQDSLAGDRTIASLTIAFAALALLLAACGLYAVLANDISGRTVELGIRMALGADRSSIVALVMSQAATLVAWGLCIGLVLAALASRLLASQLFDVTPATPWIYAAALIVFGGVGVTASLPSALRAARVSPIRSLRS